MSEENAVEEENTVENEHIEADAEQLDDEVEPSHKKRLGFWGWLLIVLIVVIAMFGLAIPRLDRDSAVYQRVTSLPVVGERVVAWNGEATGGGDQADAADVQGSEAQADSGGDSGDDASAADEVAVGGDEAEAGVAAADADVAEGADADEASDEAGASDEAVAAQSDQGEATDESAEAAGDEVADADAAGSEGESDEASDAGETAAQGNADGDAAGTDVASDEADGDEAASVAAGDDLSAENAALKAQLDALQKDLDEANSKTEEASVAASQAAQAKSLSDLEIAAISGMSMEGAIEAAEAQGVEVPEEIKSQMAGVPSAIELQNEFGEYAIQALRASKEAEAGEGFISGIGARISSEFIGRSLEPQEGSAPDAVLSRAENELRNGNLEKSLSEISTLPSEAQSAMSPWTARANQRLYVLKSIEEMMAETQSN